MAGNRTVVDQDCPAALALVSTCTAAKAKTCNRDNLFTLLKTVNKYFVILNITVSNCLKCIFKQTSKQV